ncbi:MAG: acetyltransferase domain protein [Polaromonas sp.]|nr:acetyltransferase domain protein [Polaromonas sp.]
MITPAMGLDAALADGLQRPESDAALLACHPLISQLRPQLVSAQDWLARCRHQATQGYRVMIVMRQGRCVALAGYRLEENLVWGRFLYVDDLVTDANERGAGQGGVLMDALKAEARKHDCRQLVLDSALSNALAHRFYFRAGLLARALCFTLPLDV